MSQGNIGGARRVNPTRACELGEALGQPKQRQPLNCGNTSNAAKRTVTVRRPCCRMDGAVIGRRSYTSMVACRTIKDAVVHRPSNAPTLYPDGETTG